MSWFKKKSPKSLGRQAEKAAACYLKKQGLKLLEQNYHCRFGEIDLIMQEGTTLVFVEVRCRQETARVTALESIDANKVAKIEKTALWYLKQYEVMPDCRFDVIAMTHNSEKIGYTIDWVKAAF